MPNMTTLKCSACGLSFDIRTCDLKRGRGKFCSRECHFSTLKGKGNPAYKHGHSKKSTGMTKEYNTWAGIKRRTTSDKDENSKYYIGRGIKMCDRWFNSFENFLLDMGEAPTSRHSIDRIDNEGDYTPHNCRWATRKEQMSNTRSTKLITFKGITRTQEEWGRVTGINGTNICKRLKRGWTVERALSEPLKTR